MSRIFVGDNVVIRDNFTDGRTGFNYVSSIPTGATSISCFLEIQGSNIAQTLVKLHSPDGTAYTLLNPASGTATGSFATFDFPNTTAADVGNLLTWVGADPIGLWALEAVDSVNLNRYWDGLCKWRLVFGG